MRRKTQTQHQRGVFDTALLAHTSGLCVVPPRQDGSKAPVGTWKQYQAHRPDEHQIQNWYAGGRSGVGVVCGAISGNLELFEFDDVEAYKAFKALAVDTGLSALVGRVEQGYSEQTPSGGVHWFYRCEETSGNTVLAKRGDQDGKKVMIETRGEGGYAIIAPSYGQVHPSGKPYVLLSGGVDSIASISPDERQSLFALARSLGEAPAERTSSQEGQGRPGDDFANKTSWAEILEPRSWTKVMERAEITYWRRPGKSHGVSATTNFGGSDLLHVFSTSTEFDAPASYSKFAAYAVLNHGGDFSAAAKELGKRGFGDPRPASNRPEPSGLDQQSELWLARRIVDAHGCDLRFVGAWGDWYCWDSQKGVWCEDTTGEVARRAKGVADEILTDAGHELTNAPGKAAASAAEDKIKTAIKLRRRQILTNALGLAESESTVVARPSDWDSDQWLFNVANGTINLRTGELQPQKRSDLITKCSPVVCLPDAKAPTWDAFIARVLPDASVREYLLRTLGYALTGDVTAHVLHILWGPGANGKSTFVETVAHVFGDYASVAPPSLLLKSINQRHPTEFACLHGRRLVTAAETPEQGQLNESVVKAITGGDRITTRRLYEDFWVFDPTHKLFLQTNHKPQISGTDDGIWRRIRFIAFDVTIPEEERDPELGEQLREEAPGILNQLLEGCQRWQRDGLTPPTAVRSATLEYRSSEDVLGCFIEEVTINAPGEVVEVQVLYDAYEAWCKEEGAHSVTKRTLTGMLKLRGWKRDRQNVGPGRRSYVWIGIELRKRSDRMQEEKWAKSA